MKRWLSLGWVVWGTYFLVPVLSKHAIASVIVLCATQKDKAVMIVIEF